MSGWRAYLVAAIALYFAAAAQESIARWTLLGGRVDYLLLVLSVICLYANRRQGAVFGFFAGWIFGALDGANLWQYVLSRALGGYLVAWFASSGIERGLLTALIAGFLGVVICQTALMFLAPPGSIPHYLGDTIRTAAYNGALAMLLYACLNKILGSRR